MTFIKRSHCALITLAFVVFSVTVRAETATITAQGISMDPLVIEIQSGDTVSWTNMNAHNTTSVDHLMPAGAKAWDSPIGEDYQHTFIEAGIYIYQCKPHSGLGMGGAVIVGQPVNLEAIKAANVPGPMQKIIDKAIIAAEKM